MKKFMLLVVALMLFLVAGCSKSVADEPGAQNKEKESTNVETQSDSKQIFAEMIPDPKSIFSEGEISDVSPNGGKTVYMLQVRNYKNEEYEAYVAACKEVGFDDVHMEWENDGSKAFEAYTSDGKYRVYISLDNNDERIDIVCRESTKE